jgi:hypothetical protein
VEVAARCGRAWGERASHFRKQAEPEEDELAEFAQQEPPPPSYRVTFQGFLTAAAKFGLFVLGARVLHLSLVHYYSRIYKPPSIEFKSLFFDQVAEDDLLFGHATVDPERGFDRAFPEARGSEEHIGLIDDIAEEFADAEERAAISEDIFNEILPGKRA